MACLLTSNMSLAEAVVGFIDICNKTGYLNSILLSLICEGRGC